MAIKNIPDLKTEKNQVITINGIPNEIRSAEHNPLLEDFLDSIKPRVQEIATDNTGASTLDFGLAGSNGAIIIPLSAARTITTITNSNKGDFIYLVVFNDFDFSFSMANLKEMGAYVKDFQPFTLIRLTCHSNESGSEAFTAEYINNESILNTEDNFTVNGNITYDGDIVFNNGVKPLAGIEWPFQTTNQVVTLGQQKEVIVALGSWDMDNNGTLTIPIPADGSGPSITSIQVVIHDDSQTIIKVFDTQDGGQTTLSKAANQIQLGRYSPGIFDNSNYSGTGFNRGFLVYKFLV